MSGQSAIKYQKLDLATGDSHESPIGGHDEPLHSHDNDIGDGVSRLSWQDPTVQNSGAASQDEIKAPGALHTVNDLGWSANGSSDKFNGSNVKTHDTSPLVVWGIGWEKPTVMIVSLLFGVASAVGHHIYYSYMSGRVTHDPGRQQWTIWIGTGFTFLVLFFLNSANGIAFTQHIWTILRREGITVNGVDKLIGLTGDIKGFFSLELWRRARIGIVMAFAIWGLALTSVVPPGTISVVPSLQNVTNLTNVNTFDWSYVKRYNGQGLLNYESMGGTNSWFIAYPRSGLQRLSSVVSQTGEVAYITPPASNSSYKLQFYGPSVSCNLADDSTLPEFQYYTQRILNETQIVTDQQSPPSFVYGKSHLLVWSAFSPQLWGYISTVPGQPSPDHYNNWQAELTANSVASQSSNLTAGAQLWIQLSDSSVVCQLTNASYNVEFDYPNGAQVITSRTVEHLNTWNSSITDSDDYLAYMASFNSMLYGNVTLLPNSCDANGTGTTVPPLYACLQQDGDASQVLLTSISACPEIQNSSWMQSLQVAGANPMEVQPESNCRNSSVMRALEDLGANLTTSMLGLSIESHFEPVQVPAQVSYYSSNNIYEYDSGKLMISYGTGILATLIIVLIGSVAFVINGVSHDLSFSAIMTTTRNPDLDNITIGHSIGPPSEDLARTKVRFGGVADEAGKRGVERATFGLVTTVTTLRKGGEYI